jgi:hypothetical protein
MEPQAGDMVHVPAGPLSMGTEADEIDRLASQLQLART